MCNVVTWNSQTELCNMFLSIFFPSILSKLGTIWLSLICFHDERNICLIFFSWWEQEALYSFSLCIRLLLTVHLVIKDGSIAAIHRIEIPREFNETRIDLALLASASSPGAWSFQKFTRTDVTEAPNNYQRYLFNYIDLVKLGTIWLNQNLFS